jgi:two-component system sensor histidine kinase UhpB
VNAIPDEHELQVGVASIQRRATVLAESIRGISHDLHPDVLKHGGLAAALEAHCAEISRAQPVAVSCTAEGDFDSIDPGTAFCLYRIAQEALHNVVKHSRARHAEVRLRRTDASEELTIADDGRGFDVAETWRNGKGLGLVSINERIRLAAGTLSVVTERNKGTQLHVRLPASSRAMLDVTAPSGRASGLIART